MDTKEYQARKKRKEKIRKFVVNFFIWLLIIAFVSTLGVYWGERVQINVLKVLKIDGETYKFQPGSVVNYTFLFVREKLGRYISEDVNPKLVNEFLINESVNRLLNNGLIYKFALDNKIKPSSDILRFIISYSIGGNLTRSPDKGLIDYAKMEYANMALAGDYGDIMNAIGKASSGEIMVYHDLTSFYASLEALYLDYDELISSKIEDSQLEGYFYSNISKYVDSVEIDDISVESRNIADEIYKYAKENGFESTIKKYNNSIKLSRNLKLSNKKGLSKRFFLALKHKEGEIAERVQFENGEYHIIKVLRIPDEKSLSKESRKSLIKDFIRENRENLITKNQEEIDKLFENIKSLTTNNIEFKEIARKYNISYYRISNVTPVSRYIKVDNSVIPIDLFENKELIENIFSAPIGKTSFLKTRNYFIFIKPISRQLEIGFSYTNITSETAKNYLTFKSAAISKDLMDMLKKRYTPIVYTNEIKKLIEKEL